MLNIAAAAKLCCIESFNHLCSAGGQKFNLIAMNILCYIFVLYKQDTTVKDLTKFSNYLIVDNVRIDLRTR